MGYENKWQVTAKMHRIDAHCAWHFAEPKNGLCYVAQKSLNFYAFFAGICHLFNLRHERINTSMQLVLGIVGVGFYEEIFV